MVTKYRAWHGIGACAALFALLLSGGAAAVTPPLAPPSYAAYGPLKLCTPNFSFAIGADEAVHASGDIVRIIGQDGILAIKYGGLDAAVPSAWSDPKPVPGGDGWKMARLTSATPDAGRTLYTAPQTLGDNDIRYALFDAGENKPGMIVGATAFDGSAKDAQRLARIALGPNESGDDCIVIAAALGDRDFARKEGAADDWASLFPRQWEAGPLFHCVNGVGFPLGAGAEIRRPWKSLGSDGLAFLRIGGHGIKIEPRGGGRIRPSEGASPGEHPLGWLRKTALSFHPSRGVGPPYSPAGVREPDRWSVDIDTEGYWKTGLAVSFEGDAAAATGFAFLETLEIVNADDPRCVR
jgi:hypothetical protein